LESEEELAGAAGVDTVGRDARDELAKGVVELGAGCGECQVEGLTLDAAGLVGGDAGGAVIPGEAGGVRDRTASWVMVIAEALATKGG